MRGLLDFGGPVCLLLIAMPHFLPDTADLHPASCATLVAVGERRAGQ